MQKLLKEDIGRFDFLKIKKFYVAATASLEVKW